MCKICIIIVLVTFAHLPWTFWRASDLVLSNLDRTNCSAGIPRDSGCCRTMAKVLKGKRKNIFEYLFLNFFKPLRTLSGFMFIKHIYSYIFNFTHTHNYWGPLLKSVSIRTHVLIHIYVAVGMHISAWRILRMLYVIILPSPWHISFVSSTLWNICEYLCSVHKGEITVMPNSVSQMPHIHTQTHSHLCTFNNISIKHKSTKATTNQTTIINRLKWVERRCLSEKSKGGKREWWGSRKCVVAS